MILPTSCYKSRFDTCHSVHSVLQLGVGCIWALLLWGYPDTRKLPELTVSSGGLFSVSLVGMTCQWGDGSGIDHLKLI